MAEISDVIRWAGRVLATVIAIVVGIFVLADFFLARWSGNVFGLKQVFNDVGSLLVSWAGIVIAFALLLGFANIVTVHWDQIRARKSGAVYSSVLLVSLALTLVFGLRGPSSSPGEFIFEFILCLPG